MTLRLGLWQCRSHPADVAGNLARLSEQAFGAAAAGIDLLVCPEMYLSGYALPGDVVRRLAQPADGPWAREVSEIAARTGVAVLYGFPELAPDGAVYNAVRLVDRRGAQVAVHRKTHLFGDIDARAVTASDTPPAVVELDGWRVGLLICYEVEFPELVRVPVLAGADVICVPTANMPEYDAVQSLLIRARAFENQVFVAYANYCGSESGVDYGGSSVVAGPDGAVVAQAGREPDLVVADLDREVLAASRAVNPYLAARRPELYRPD